MDDRRFDDLTRSFSSAASRRRLLSTLASGLVALVAAGRADSDETLAKKRRRVTAQGPCGDGGPKDNECERNKQCCTGICKRGRCRCKRLGTECSEDRNCCATFGQPMSCQNRICQTVQSIQAPPSPPPPDSAPPPPTTQAPSPAECGVCGPCQICVGTTCQPCPGCCSGGVCVASCPICQACVGGQCVAANEGQVCGTQSEARGGAIRCCNGTCPDPDCIPGGPSTIPCGSTIPCDQGNCCAQNGAICMSDSTCFCLPGPGPVNLCGSDTDCIGTGLTTACICGTCQRPPA